MNISDTKTTNSQYGATTTTTGTTVDITQTSSSILDNSTYNNNNNNLGHSLFGYSPETEEVVCELPVTQPVYLSNPDGSLFEGVPPGYKDLTPPPTPRRFVDSLTFLNVSDVYMYEDDILDVYIRHSRVFCLLMLVLLSVETSLNAVFIYFSSYSVREVSIVYPNLSSRHVWIIFTLCLTLEIIYVFSFYLFGFMALILQKPSWFKGFSRVALFGIFSQVLLAYMNKFNMLIFFLRLISYLYSKFLRNLLQAMQLVPNINTHTHTHTHTHTNIDIEEAAVRTTQIIQSDI
eukprot:GHVR01043097.1.p1 GENE.GHVR01043097.1~~GHVR01043097.1.p1  ORF type:complete len:290 (+),score=77.83 GHVR01043097.1:125-994(+)